MKIDHNRIMYRPKYYPPSYSTSSNEKSSIFSEELKTLLRDSDSVEQQTSPVLCAVGIPSLELTVRAQQKMARHRMMKISATLIHVTLAVATGCYTFYSFVGLIGDKQCLPPIVDYFGDPIKFNHGLSTVCEAVYYSTCVLCCFNVLMSVGIICTWPNTGIMTLHFLMSVLMTLCAVFSGTMFSVYFMVWCDSVTQKYTIYPQSCRSAAEDIDQSHKTYNMTWYYDRMVIQQGGMWAIVPLLVIIIFIYTTMLRFNAAESTQEPSNSGNFQYVILHDESTPLLNPVSSMQSSVPASRNREGPPPRYRTQADDTRDAPGHSEPFNNPFEVPREETPTS